MLSLARPVLRLIIVPAAVAAVTWFALWDAGGMAAIGVSWCVFALCVVVIGAWGNIRLERTRRRLRSLHDHGSRRAR